MYHRQVFVVLCGLSMAFCACRRKRVEAQKSEKPMLANVIQDILSQQSQSGKSQHYQDIANVKNAANMLIFLTENNISDIADLDEKVIEGVLREDKGAE
ncbi:MAG: hypothetical protein FWG90_06105 [Oscillospiraceae bacterium]|nr:hypothetical protein [Oscillospiraceae bacterium]